MSLGPSTGARSSLRPHQQGELKGRRKILGAPYARPVEWLVDTGADISTVRNQIASGFQVSSVGLSASPTTGGGGIQVVTGLTAEFQVEDAGGTIHTAQAMRYMGIKSNNAGSDLLGMNHIAEVGATVRWEPTAALGALMI